jgi:hypothetical protein
VFVKWIVLVSHEFWPSSLVNFYTGQGVSETLGGEWNDRACVLSCLFYSFNRTVLRLVMYMPWDYFLGNVDEYQVRNFSGFCVNRINGNEYIDNRIGNFPSLPPLHMLGKCSTTELHPQD